MLNIFRKSLLLAGIFIAAQVNAQDNLVKPIPELAEVWTVEDLNVPESVLEVGRGKHSYFLVSLVDGDPFDKDGKGGVAKINSNGKLLAKEWVTGLNAPKGMAVHKDWLYIADIDELVVVDIKTANVVLKIPVPGAVFLNDVAVDKKGNVFVSDTFTDQIIRVKNLMPEVYLENVTAANGLYFQGNTLLVGAGAQLLVYDKHKNSSVIASGFPSELDGVAPAGRGDYLVSSWEGQIYWVSGEGEKSLLLDTVEQSVNTADFAYSEKRNILVVPNFFANRVTAYKVNNTRP